MYDVVVIGQGLTGMLSAIWAREQGYRTALVATGTGKIMQSTGVIDLIPGANGGLKEWAELYQIPAQQLTQLPGAIEQFIILMDKLGYPYKGNFHNLVPIVTGSGHIKKTALYPGTIAPIPEQGHVVIVGFQEVVDFQPEFVKGNLQKVRPKLEVDAIKVQLGNSSQRTMTQLDAALLLDKSEIRTYCINQINEQMTERNISQPDLFIFPASLGLENWQGTLEHFTSVLNAVVTEAPGLPPNATAIRLNERLKNGAVKSGVRFYFDTTVVGCRLEGEKIQSLVIKTANKKTDLNGKQFILASGGVLGGGLEVTSEGVKETVLRLEADQYGELMHCPANLYPVGASNGMKFTHNGITGGVYSLFSTFESAGKLRQQLMIGGTIGA